MDHPVSPALREATAPMAPTASFAPRVGTAALREALFVHSANRAAMPLHRVQHLVCFVLKESTRPIQVAHPVRIARRVQQRTIQDPFPARIAPRAPIRTKAANPPAITV